MHAREFTAIKEFESDPGERISVLKPDIVFQAKFADGHSGLGQCETAHQIVFIFVALRG